MAYQQRTLARINMKTTYHKQRNVETAQRLSIFTEKECTKANYPIGKAITAAKVILADRYGITDVVVDKWYIVNSKCKCTLADLNQFCDEIVYRNLNR